MTLDAALAEASQRVQSMTFDRADRILISQKFAFEHDRRSFGQRHRQTCERVRRIFEDLEARYGNQVSQ